MCLIRCEDPKKAVARRLNAVWFRTKGYIIKLIKSVRFKKYALVS